MTCERHGSVAERVITAPVLVASQAECRYDSPITGEPITSWAARRNDLAKHGCRPYDPEMKTDDLRKSQECETAIDRAVEATVEEAIAKMPTKQRGQLHSELTEQGYGLELERKAVGG